MSQIADQVGRVVGGRYRLVSPVGSGSSAHVYRAEDSRLGRAVAIKMLHAALADDDTFLKRFRAEAQAAAALNHPHIMRVFDWGDDDAGPYLVLEYLAGGSLQSILDAGNRLSVEQAARVGLEAAKALEYAHRRSLVHRDIKPANLLFDEEGRTAIADFGLARALAEAAWTEPVGAILGTARYASPETAQGRVTEGRSDVYSLGLVLLEAVTGELPFSGDTTLSVLMARIGTPVEAPGETGLIGRVIEAATAPALDDRLTSAELAADLESVTRRMPAPDPLPLVPGERGTLSASRSADGETRIRTPQELAAEAGLSGSALVPGAVADGTGRASPRLHRRVRSQSPRGAHAAPRPTDAKPPNPWRTKIVLAAAVAVTLGAGAAYAVEAKLFVPKRTAVAVVGETPAQARAGLAARHLGFAVSGHAYSTKAAAGLVASQSPAGGARIPQGTVVSVVISDGPPPVGVPSLSGLSRDAAVARLADAHLVAAATPVFSETVPAGQVISWSPTSGAHWGDTVTVQVSGGPAPRTLTDYAAAGDTYAKAAADLQSQGLVPSESDQFSSSVPAGQVIGTQPAAGTQVPRGANVTVLVSKGPQMIPIPNVTGMKVDDATTALENAGFTVQNVYGPPKGKVFQTDPPQGTSAPKGSPVALYTM